MTPNQIKWASEHDWYVSNTGCSVHVKEIVTRAAYTTKEGIHFPYAVIERGITFNDFKELRDWAGY